MFERLINNQTKKVMLTCQHRMRPEISVLMKHFYELPIEDHISIKSFPRIIGLGKDIFFLNHSYPEANSEDSQSKQNFFEANYISELCAYLLKQKYEESQITILSMYLAQMMRIKKLLKLKGITTVKVTTVDNYQGEENDIIILSLVRSNDKDSIGFLKTNNRLCVALSRAKQGFYVVGNLELMYRNSATWVNIIETIKAANSYGNQLRLTCGRHRQNDLYASEPEHFTLRPDGGCQLPCDFRLECGHVCGMCCHTFDLEHEEYSCKKICDKLMEECGHMCKQTCSHLASCNECLVKLDKFIPECGHTIKFRCDTSPTKENCYQPCEAVLKCGHRCTKKCGEECGDCEVLVPATKTCSLHYGDNFMAKCSDKKWILQEKCKDKCTDTLKCGHVCSGDCSKCYGGYIHADCTQKCDRPLFCGHLCDISCSEQCKPCNKKCQNKCKHSRCVHRCSDICQPCVEKCKWKCRHMKCSKKCSELCDREACQQACQKKLKCGHDCIGMCGEKCPRLCRVCNRDKVCEILFGTEDDPNARFVLLEDCNHIVESKSMDKWLAKTYAQTNSSISLPACPRCTTPIRITLRYMNYVKVQLNAIEEIKKKQYGDFLSNKTTQADLLKDINSQQLLIKKEYERLQETARSTAFQKFVQQFVLILDRRYTFPFNELVEKRNTWMLFIRLEYFSINILKKAKSNNLNIASMQHLHYEIAKLKKYFYNQATNMIYNNTGQVLNEIKNEIERVEFVYEYYVCKQKVVEDFDYIKAKHVDGRVLDKLCELERVLINKVKQFDTVQRSLVEDVFDELKPLLEFEISKEKKVEILKAIGLNKGHWFKCPDGHIYCIGECGGAMEKSVCPECKQDIGGLKHKLTDGNELASEMDGAQAPAFNNQIYQIEDLD